MKKLFVDTSYLIALSNTKDAYHQKAKSLNVTVKQLHDVWTHEGILLEISDWLAKRDRHLASKTFKAIRQGKTNLKLIPLTTDLIDKAFELYEKYNDKTVGLTDCISFVVMNEKGITDALTSDKHFVQVGFKALLLND